MHLLAFLGGDNCVGAWNVTRPSILAFSPTMIGEPSSARIELRRPVLLLALRPQQCENSSTTFLPIVGLTGLGFQEVFGAGLT